MGAFDGIKIPYDCGYASTGFKNDYQHFPNYSFSFFKGFGEPELRKLLAAAEEEGSDTIWVPDKYRRSSGIGLDTWYVRALLNHHFRVE